MLSAGLPPIGPMPVEGGGSWVWVLVAIGVVVGMLELLWLARLWERHGRVDEEAPEALSTRSGRRPEAHPIGASDRSVSVRYETRPPEGAKRSSPPRSIWNPLGTVMNERRIRSDNAKLAYFALFAAMTTAVLTLPLIANLRRRRCMTPIGALILMLSIDRVATSRPVRPPRARGAHPSPATAAKTCASATS
jgi:hypothetical protein